MAVNQHSVRHHHALFLTITIYFFWGFSASANTLLIPLVKDTFGLLQWQSQLIEFSFYAAYFSGSLMYIFASATCQQLVQKISTRLLIITGLIISLLGTLLLVFSLSLVSFSMILLSLFIIALGFSLQQIAANPTLVSLGGAKDGIHRLTIAGALGSMGNMIAPMLLGYFAFSTTVGGSSTLEGGDQLTALIPVFYSLALGYLLFILGYIYIEMPNLQSPQSMGGSVKELLAGRGFLLGAIALFFYVGGEVTLQSNLPELLKNSDFLGLSTANSLKYISLFGGGLLIGRCTAAIFNFSLQVIWIRLGILLIPQLTFIFVLGLMTISGVNISTLLGFAPFLVALSVGLLFSGVRSDRILFVSGSCAVLLLLVSLLNSGYFAMYCLLAVSMFSAVMWPCIFSLALEGVEGKIQLASSVLVMMVLGGAIIPPLQGYLSDIEGIGIHRSYFVPLLCYLVVAYYGFYKWSSQNKELQGKSP